HITRNLDQLLSLILMPVMFLILFRYVFGGAIDTGDTTYPNFLLAGILVETLAFGSSNTTVNIVLDLKRGIVDRFRSLPMNSSALLTGHVIADLFRNTISGLIMLIAGFVVGFRPTAGPIEWLAVFGLLLLFTFAMSWFCAILGLIVKSLEAAQWVSYIFIMPLTFASSAFVPTDGMPAVLRVFAENQPFTIVIQAMRAWLVGTPIGNAGWLSVVWCIAITLVAMPTAAWLFRRQTQIPSV
ncbi:MAG: ABC transporter permease, partial [Thermodesulfobacteriota bacterium]